MINSRRMMMIAQGSSILPSEYQQVEWIGVSSNQIRAYINTGLVPYKELCFETEISETTYPFGSTSVDSIFFGADRGYSSFGYCIGINNSTTYNMGVFFHMQYSVTNNISKSGILPESDVFMTYRYENGDCYINENKVISGNTYSNLGAILPIYIFALNRNGITEHTTFENMKIKYLRFYVGHGDVMNLIPCYRKSDNVAGMYDLVSKQFFTNAGSGSFVVGPNV